MKVNVMEKDKLVEVWLTNEEQTDERLRAELQEMYKMNKAKGFLTTVFFSGETSLYQQTTELLQYNRKRKAQLEVQQGCC